MRPRGIPSSSVPSGRRCRIALAASFAAAAIVSVLVARKILRPVRQVRSATRRLAAGHYDEPVAEPAELELAELARDVNLLAVQLQTTERRRARLIGEVAHEMRTPLTTIEGLVEGMLDEVFEPNEEVLTSLAEEATRLQRLASDLSELSRAEEGAIALNLERVDLGELAEACANRLRPQYEDKHVELEVRTAAVAPGRRRPGSDHAGADQPAAATRSPTRRRAVASSCTASRDGDVASVAVADTGVGLAAADLELVFDRFYRVPGPARPSGGSGIGLTIARGLAHAHHGDVARVLARSGPRVDLHPDAPDRRGRRPRAAELHGTSIAARRRASRSEWFALGMSTEERIIEVMGTTAHLVVTDGNATLAERAVERLHELEARWSRFRPDSEISRLNARPGMPVVVSAETYALVERAVEGAAMTGGLFDPTLLPELRDAGYDRSFELIGVRRSTPTNLDFVLGVRLCSATS